MSAELTDQTLNQSLAAPANVRLDEHDDFHVLMALATCGALLISCAGYLFANLSLSLVQAAPLVGVLLLLLVVAGQYRWRQEPECFNVVMMATWVIVITNCHFFPMYMAAGTSVPMNDALLAGCDRFLGFSVPGLMALLAPYPGIQNWLLFIYGTLIPMMTAATILPPLWKRMDQAKYFAFGCVIAATISLPIFACLQAVGPWDYYGYEPPIESLNQKASIFAVLKTDNEFLIDVSNRDGLITFPSFHVALTILAANALWFFRRLRPITFVWAALIVFSTVATGIHYLIDVIGGTLVAIIAIYGARRLADYRLPAGLKPWCRATSAAFRPVIG